jgi:hypothetical protein
MVSKLYISNLMCKYNFGAERRRMEGNIELHLGKYEFIVMNCTEVGQDTFSYKGFVGRGGMNFKFKQNLEFLEELSVSHVLRK